MTRVVLALDTATAAVTAGLVRVGSAGAELLAERVTVDARGHAERLTPNIVAALDDCGLSMSDIGAVVVGCGPGPFTGLRVGMATAAALGHALDVPVYPVCTLDGIAAVGSGDGDVLVVTDARRREVYWARYRAGVRLEGPAVAAPADVPGAAEALADGPRYPSSLGLVAAVADFGVQPEPLVPLYLRRPDARTLAERGLA